MALWPNTRTDILGRQPVGISGYLAFQETDQRRQRALAYFAGDGIEETSSIPEGAFQGAACILPPLVAGGMASGNQVTDFIGTATGNALAGGPVVGTAGMLMSQAGGLSLQVTMVGDGTITIDQAGALALTIALGGNGAATITGAGGLSMIVPFDGNAAAVLTAAADLRGRLSLAGDITPFTTLSPENLAAAVGGIEIDGAYTLTEVLRLLVAVAAGKTDIDTSGPDPIIRFRDLNDIKDRITATMTGSERATVVKDAT
jgi:hypothetical protein